MRRQEAAARKQRQEGNDFPIAVVDGSYDEVDGVMNN
jgi:hypothetical protein